MKRTPAGSSLKWTFFPGRMSSVKYFVSQFGLHTHGLIASCNMQFNKGNVSGYAWQLAAKEASLGLHKHKERCKAEATKRELLAFNNGCMRSRDSKLWREDTTRRNSVSEVSLLLKFYQESSYKIVVKLMPLGLVCTFPASRTLLLYFTLRSPYFLPPGV